MANTPEGKIKGYINDALKTCRERTGKCWWFMPVPGGFGRPSLDYIGTVNGRSFAIEAKAPGKVPTDRQNQTIMEMRAAGVRVFIIDSKEGAQHFFGWLVGLID